ncbi:hypothetical protein TNCV_5050501 [Trichonephila clavipes]|nr:hypothetical protein TNCV_5050501 [Trichonephila clavipes]
MKNKQGAAEITMQSRSYSSVLLFALVGPKSLKIHRFETTGAIQMALPGDVNSLMDSNFEAEYIATSKKNRRTITGQETNELHDDRSTGLIKSIKLEGQKTVTENWYTTKCLPEFSKKLLLGD